ncbi:MAG: glycerol kinase, partial [Clostridia bacterium]|nr:glycerol kinase [Clostridia bacterium]
MEKYVLSFDAGTTSSRAIVFDSKQHIVSIAQKEFTQYYPQPSWVEHDAAEIWNTQLTVAREALEKAGISGSDVNAIGITNQRETTIVWDKKTGAPLCNAIVWQCRRTAQICDEISAAGYFNMIREKTGLIPDAYFSATKL